LTALADGKARCLGEVEDHDGNSYESVRHQGRTSITLVKMPCLPLSGLRRQTEHRYAATLRRLRNNTTDFKRPGEVLRATRENAGQEDLLLAHRPAESAERRRESKTVPGFR
jgi:hypothetical protein